MTDKTERDALVARCRAAVNACEAQRMPATAKLLQEAAEALDAPAETPDEARQDGYELGLMARAGQPADCVGCEGTPAEGNNPCAVCGRGDPPAASVDVEKLRGKVALWRQRENSDEPQTEFDRGYEQASDECADALAALIDSAGGAKVCTCPSGDGSLRWPCPQHPPQETPVEGDGAVEMRVRHEGNGLLALYNGDKQIREIGITPGWYSKDRDEFILRYNNYTRPAATAQVPEGWRVLNFTGSFKTRGERWEVYDPDGNGGAICDGDVADPVLRNLLDAIAAQQAEGEDRG